MYNRVISENERDLLEAADAVARIAIELSVHKEKGKLWFGPDDKFAENPEWADHMRRSRDLGRQHRQAISVVTSVVARISKEAIKRERR